MSLVKFARCHYFLFDKREARFSRVCLTTFSKVSTTWIVPPKKLNNADCLPKQSYATSVKAHMTPALQKWKQKKRKSRKQQNKEFDKLHEDLIKLLTKRAIELVKNKSVLEAQRGVVTTHVFTSFPHLEGSDRSPASGSGEASDFHPFTFRNQSDYVAQALEAQLQDKLKHAEKSNDKVGHKLQDVNIPKITSVADSINLSDVFQNHTKHSTKRLMEHTPIDFTSNFDKFSSELASVLKNRTTNSLSSPIRAWDVDVNPEQENADSTNFGGKGSGIKLSNDNVSLQSSLKQRSLPESEKYHTNDFLEKEVKSSRSKLSDLDMPQQEWHPISSAVTVTDPDDDHHERLLESMGAVGHPLLSQSEHAVEILSGFSENIEALDIPEADHSQQLAGITQRKPSSAHTKPSKKQGKRLKKVAAAAAIPQESLEVKTKRKKDASESLDHHVKARPAEHLNVSRELQELIDRSFVEVSCFTNSEMVAVRNLQYQALKHKLISIEVFNQLIRSLAKKKDLQTIKTLFSIIKQQELLPTLQTYAGCLECIGRMPVPDKDACEKMLADISKKELDLKEISNMCSFESDEWEYVLKAIKLVETDFSPNPPKLITEYDNELLGALNAHSEQKLEKNPYAMDISSKEFHAKARAQLEMEKTGEVVVDSIFASSVQEAQDSTLKSMRQKVLDDWRHVLLKSFEQKLAMHKKKAHDNVNMTLYPYLKLFPSVEYVNIIFTFLRELLSLSEGYSPTQALIQAILGRAVNRKYNIESKVSAGMGEKMLRLHELYMEKYLDRDFMLDNHRLMWLRSMYQNPDTVNMDMSTKKWPSHIIREIGKFLLEMILYDLKVNANLFRSRAPERIVPAFCSIFRPDVSFITNAEVKLHPIVTRLFNSDNMESFTFDPSTVPMIVPPVPWISKKMGGLFLGSHALVRMGPDMFHVDALKTVTEKQYPAVLDSLNTLSACAWKINQPILDLQIEIFNNKGDARLKVAPPASQLPPMPVITEDMSSKEKAELYRERLHLQQQKQDMHGLWCTDLYRLSIANKFRDETFWFPHSMDFRGRTYPMPPHFNHLGSDNVRSMLLFAKGKPLGKNGYDWLKIHLINLTGFKKRCSNSERLEYASSLMDDILDSADRPLTGKKWWQTSDEPWQTLACCKEIAKIERFQGNKEDYMCHFPVHQDGSCNGLQHYAALGRDQAGAESVNLHPFDVPQDVYSDVVLLVEKVRQKHAEDGNEVAQALDGFVKRKVIKQTIMTTVYGVTKYGAKLQIHRQLKDIPDFPADLAWKGSFYLTDTTFTCLREMFTATKDIQDWLTESAKHISSLAPVDWITPLGFPVLQPYFKRLSRTESRHDKFKPNIMKQKNAFPPNYIHSLDSTHMMLTSLHCMHTGVTFVSVHDCYWTHAADVPIMNKICREQFVNMHKQPLLENLSEHLISLVKRASKDPNLEEDVQKVDKQILLNLLSNIPKRGSFDLDNVLKSTYFFS